MKLNKIALGVALASGAFAVQAADTLLFPYVVSGGSVTTLVSVINTDTTGAATEYYNANGSVTGNYDPSSTKYLHWRYHVKTANTAASDCYENNGYFPTSPLDMVTYDVSGTRGQGGVMFNDPSVKNNWKAEGDVNQLSAITLEGERAVLFVHNAGNTGARKLAGEALIVEFDTGAAWGYAAEYQGNAGSSADEDFDFSFVGNLDVGVSFMPLNEVTTRFFVTPVNYDEDYSILSADGLDDPKQIFGKWTATVDLAPVTGSIRVVNRDEGGISGGVTAQAVTCVWPVDASALITSNNVRAYANVQGGWANLITVPVSLAAAYSPTSASDSTPDVTKPTGKTDKAVGIKLDFRPAGAGGEFQMSSGVGAFNSAYRLNDSLR